MQRVQTQRWVLVLVAALSLAAPLALTGPTAAAVSPAKPYDLDGNGYPDLVVGAPGLQVGAVEDTGGVVVLPASAKGLSSAETVISNPYPTPPEADDFGEALTSADFNRDGYADLAVGAPGTRAGDGEFAGAVVLFYGSPRGPDTAHPVRLPFPGSPTEAFFGAALAAGDLTGDGYADLVVGAPTELVKSYGYVFYPSGTVRVFPGGPGGVGAAPVSTLRADVDPDTFDVEFGNAIAVADVDLDGQLDLVVGSAGVSTEEQGYPGSLSYCDGRRGGPVACRQLLHGYDLSEMLSVAVGNVSGGPGLEIAAGVPDRNGHDPGVVLLVELVPRHPDRVAKVRKLTKASKGVPGAKDELDLFGWSLALGDLDRDGHADLVIGAYEARNGRGRVTVVHGAAGGWRSSGNDSYTQDTAGVPGQAERNDWFGSALTLLDHDGDGHLDLTVGAPGEDHDAGGITTFRGVKHGFTTKGSREVKLSRLGYAHPAHASFGSSLGR